MAILSTIECERCGKIKDVGHMPSQPTPRICRECDGEIAAGSKREHLEKLQRLSVGERLSRIEERLYNDAKNPTPIYWNGPIG